MYSRPFKRVTNHSDEENEFANLWVERTTLKTSHKLPGILRWFPVVDTKVYELSPLENAVETMQKTNKELKTLIQEHLHSNSPVPINPLSLKLTGIIDAAVMGGTAMYEKAFFSEDFRSRHQEQRENIVLLENLMAEQIPLLELGIKIHDDKKSDKLKPLHERLTIMFREMKDNVESKYGRRDLGPEFKLRANQQMRRQSTINSGAVQYRNSGTPTIASSIAWGVSGGTPNNRDVNNELVICFLFDIFMRYNNAQLHL